jgi:hypothetical protein
MAEQSGSKWIVLGLLICLPVLLALWPLTLIAGLIAFGLRSLRHHRELMLQDDMAAWLSRRKGAVCRYGNRHGLVEALTLRGTVSNRELVLNLKLLEADGSGASFTPLELPLPGAASPRQAWSAALNRQLRSLDVELLNAMAVEHQAVQTAEAWFKELTWTRTALGTLEQMEADLRQTLKLAPGNDLLEPGIPQLKEAQQRLISERQQLTAARQETLDVLRQLVDFLSVPKSVRSLLNFDPQRLHDPGRLKELRRSFQDLVMLNDVFRELSAQKLI